MRLEIINKLVPFVYEFAHQLMQVVHGELKMALVTKFYS